MDKESRVILDEILAKDPQSITEGDAAILRARSYYLSNTEKERFADALHVAPEKPDYSKMKNDDLLALLTERRITVPETATKKADYITLLEEADKVIE